MIYSKDYVEPIDFRDLPANINELGERVYLPVKAMLSSQRISYTYDPLLE